MEDHIPAQTRTQRLLTSLGESIIDKPPYISGILRLPNSSLSLFYKVTGENGNAARYIDLGNATFGELEQLTQACEPATFGLNQEDVLDETYRKAGKLDPESFSLMLDLSQTNLQKIIGDYLLESTPKTDIIAEQYKLNVYSKESFFKPHVDTPRGNKMFGSLVIVFPTPHEGGALHLRHLGHEWIFDSGQALAAEGQISIGYVAFFSDIEHEVAPVVSGHRVTLTYNLYFGDSGPVSKNDTVSAQPSEYLPQSIPLRPENEGAFRDAFTALLEDLELLANGGILGFGLRHGYPIENDLEHVYSVLKGSDVVVYQSILALGYEPVLYVFYKDWCKTPLGVLVDNLVDFPGVLDYNDVLSIGEDEGGIVVCTSGGRWVDRNSRYGGTPVPMEWATQMRNFNRQQADVVVWYGNDASSNTVYGDVCLGVCIGKAGDRLAFTTVAEMNEAYWKRQEERHEWDYTMDFDD